MPDYICKNKKCSEYNKVKTEAKAVIKVAGYQIIDEAAVCPECGKERKNYKVDGFSTQIHGSNNIPI